jgi:hypothetical protein
LIRLQFGLDANKCTARRTPDQFYKINRVRKGQSPSSNKGL